jgi:hypothetical protein
VNKEMWFRVLLAATVFVSMSTGIILGYWMGRAEERESIMRAKERLYE